MRIHHTRRRRFAFRVGPIKDLAVRRFPGLLTLVAAVGLSLFGGGGCDSCQSSPAAPVGSSPPPAEPASRDDRADVGATVTPADAPVPGKCKLHCKVTGKCGWSTALQGCVARSSADCEQSRACRVNGTCTFNQGACAGGSHEDCQKSTRCKEEGLCHARPPGRGMAPTNCYARTDEDCAQSELCKERNRCKAINGFCEDPANPRKSLDPPKPKPE